MERTTARQIDIGVALGIVPDRIPGPVGIEELFSAVPPEPKLLVEGVLHQGCKMLLGGTSKSNKSWALLDLAVSVASGIPWWGRNTTRGRCLYVNFELPDWSIVRRLEAIGRAKQGVDLRGWLDVWNLRGRAGDFAKLRPELEKCLVRRDYGLLVVDPVYKLLGERDENANGDIADLMNEFEALAMRTDAAVVMAHHFAKGESSSKDAIDRISGAGAWGRDPDCVMVLTPHEEPECFTVSSILRNLAPTDDVVVQWEFPLLKLRGDLDPSSLRRRGAGGRKKTLTDTEFMDACLNGRQPVGWAVMVAAGEKAGIGKSSVGRYVARLVERGIVATGNGMYWVKN